MPFNAAWIIAAIGLVLAIGVWARSKRVGPAVGVLIGGVVIMMIADPSMLTWLAGVGKNLLRTVIDNTLNV